MNSEEYAKAIYSLKLGERYIPDNNSAWTRVPGGWIYTQGNPTGAITSIFIPWDNEFQLK